MYRAAGASFVRPRMNVITASRSAAVNGELRHPQPLVVPLGARRFVIEAPRHPQLLPEEAVPLMRIERLQEVGRVGIVLIVERIELGVAAVLLVVRMLQSSRAAVARRASWPAAGPVDAVRCQERADVLERELRRILAAPVRQRRANRLGRFDSPGYRGSQSSRNGSANGAPRNRAAARARFAGVMPTSTFSSTFTVAG